MKFILHGGFHKTATTHIQRTLEANTEVLARQGVVVAPHVLLRRHYTRIATDEGMGLSAHMDIDAQNDQAAVDELFDQLRFGDTKRLVFSEENFIGHVGQVANAGDFYQNPRRALSKFSEQLPVEPTDILLSVRSYAQFFASCYVEHLGSAPAKHFVTPDIMAAKVMGNMPSWTRLIDMFADVFPNARLVVWRYEDFRGQYDRVMQELVGMDAHPSFASAQGTAARDTRARKSVGARTMQAFFDRLAKDGLETALMRWRDIKAEYADQEDGAPFDPWTDQQRKHLDATYKADWAEILNDTRVTIID